MTQKKFDETDILKTILDDIADGIIVVDTQGRVILVNKAAKAMSLPQMKPGLALSGQVADAMIRDSAGRLLPAREFPILRALHGETVADYEVIVRMLDGNDAYFSTTSSPLRDRRGKITGAIAVYRDISERKRSEARSASLLRKLGDQQRLILAVADNVPAHVVFVDPDLNVVWANKQTSAALGKRKEEIVGPNFYAVFVGSEEQIGGLVRRALTTGQPPRIVVDRMALTTTRHSLNLSTKARPIVQADRDRLEQVLINLLDNAMKYSPPSGPSLGRIDIRVYEEDGKAVVSVRDYGIGIPPEKQEHIFERFYRAHAGTPSDYGGMGVGLYISKEIVSRHGGHIWFESQVAPGRGKGSTFYFSLPLDRSAGHKSQKTP